MYRPESSKIEVFLRDVSKSPYMGQQLVEALEEALERAEREANQSARASLFTPDATPGACACHGAAGVYRQLLAMAKKHMKEQP